MVYREKHMEEQNIQVPPVQNLPSQPITSPNVNSSMTKPKSKLLLIIAPIIFFITLLLTIKYSFFVVAWFITRIVGDLGAAGFILYIPISIIVYFFFAFLSGFGTARLMDQKKYFLHGFLIFWLLVIVTAPIIVLYNLNSMNRRTEQFKTETDKRLNIDLTPTNSFTTPNPTINPNTEWKTYSITPDSTTGFASYIIKLPSSWKQIEHSSNFQTTETFKDNQNMYTFIIEEQKNLNPQTGKPFTNFQELTGLPYDSTLLTVNNEPATRPLPRAGSENIYKVMLFSKDKTLIYNITLETSQDGSKIEEGGIVFNQILSTFKFTN